MRINGQHMYLWRAVDDEGDVLDILVQKRRNKRAAFTLMKTLLKTRACLRKSWSLTDWLRRVLQPAILTYTPSSPGSLARE